MPDEKADISPIADPKLILKSRKMELDAEEKKFAHEAKAKKMGLEVGWLGKFVGMGRNAANNVAFLAIVFSFLTGVALSLAHPDQWERIWSLVTPLITLSLGYLFGNRNGSPTSRRS
jgi:hypothetical protein